MLQLCYKHILLYLTRYRYVARECHATTCSRLLTFAIPTRVELYIREETGC